MHVFGRKSDYPERVCEEHTRLNPDPSYCEARVQSRTCSCFHLHQTSWNGLTRSGFCFLSGQTDMPEVKVKRKPRCVLRWNPQNLQNAFSPSFVFYISPVNDQKTEQTCREPMLVSRPCFYIMTIKLLLKLWCIPWYWCSKVGYRKIILNRNQILSSERDARSGCKMNLVVVTELLFQPWEFHKNLRWYKGSEMLENRRQIKKYTPVYFLICLL